MGWKVAEKKTSDNINKCILHFDKNEAVFCVIDDLFDYLQKMSKFKDLLMALLGKYTIVVYWI